jgi:hypothetical protein
MEEVCVYSHIIVKTIRSECRLESVLCPLFRNRERQQTTK